MSDLFSFVSCQILPTKLISKAHVGFFCLSRVKFYAQNLKRRQFFWNFWIQCVVSSFTKKLILISHVGLVLVSLVSNFQKLKVWAIFTKKLISISRVGFVFVCLVSNFMEKVNFNLTVKNVFVCLVSNFTC